ncbi:HxlR-like helix-turn-helix [Candidatus Methanoplasma termitum]|uniref:HxlR-like helix-turn-helix n=1 Tax=Candidatus Methanoplasma termitum TaxID=1577791 RepID=A0A0A7LBT4_9ARCH|nr:helix-turn-helix domain-containing protein [Candidatus Methanoplasma termitum]AIZ56585.1 HxlR-like helix-turn-helix [Candidatus Methanoplasma termitum]MCL2333832.1 helix-turn-helix transcriptional regulator [Candidatus Methanoplasma sp.]
MGNKSNAPRMDCALDAAMAVIEGKWKAAILCKLCVKGTLRFNQLMKELEVVSPRILTKQLREMEKDGLIIRAVKSEIPVGVEYSISEKGLTLIPALKILAEWGVNNVLRYNVKLDDSIILPHKEDQSPFRSADA